MFNSRKYIGSWKNQQAVRKGVIVHIMWHIAYYMYVIDTFTSKHETECFMKYTGTSTRASCHVHVY